MCYYWIDYEISEVKLLVYPMSKNQLIGPFFFKDDAVNGDNYLSILQQFFIREIRKWHKLRSRWCSCALLYQYTTLSLDNRFLNRWIGRGGAIRWTPPLPHSTPVDFYWWEHLKSNVYKSPIKDIDELKMRINMGKLSQFRKDYIEQWLFFNIVKRMNLCISVDGDHFEYFL